MSLSIKEELDNIKSMIINLHNTSGMDIIKCAKALVNADFDGDKAMSIILKMKGDTKMYNKKEWRYTPGLTVDELVTYLTNQPQDAKIAILGDTGPIYFHLEEDESILNIDDNSLSDLPEYSGSNPRLWKPDTPEEEIGFKIEQLSPEKIKRYLNGVEKLRTMFLEKIPYVAENYYTDPMGSTFSNDDHWEIIGYGNTVTELEEYCESLGYEKSKKEFDKGYIIEKNKYFKEVDKK